MSLEKITKLASVEIIFPDRAVNAAWHTYITENGDVISGPSIHRKAFPNEDISEVLPEITEFISADYLQLVAQNTQLLQQIAALEQIGHLHSSSGARIAELEEAVRTALLTIQEQAELIHQLQQVPSEPLVQEANTAATD